MKGTYSETELIEGIRQADNQLMGRVYKAHFGVIAHFIQQNQGTMAEAKDIYQEAFMVLYEKLKDSSFELNCQIKTFLYAVCRRMWLKRLRQKSPMVNKVEDFEEFIRIDEAQENEMDEKEAQFTSMNQALARLGEPCSTILQDFYIQNLNMLQITEKMGYTNADNAKNQKYKCLQRLKKLFFEGYKAP